MGRVGPLAGWLALQMARRRNGRLEAMEKSETRGRRTGKSTQGMRSSIELNITCIYLMLQNTLETYKISNTHKTHKYLSAIVYIRRYCKCFSVAHISISTPLQNAFPRRSD